VPDRLFCLVHAFGIGFFKRGKMGDALLYDYIRKLGLTAGCWTFASWWTCWKTADRCTLGTHTGNEVGGGTDPLDPESFPDGDTDGTTDQQDNYDRPHGAHSGKTPYEVLREKLR
jgi:hypothetical protein